MQQALRDQSDRDSDGTTKEVVNDVRTADGTSGGKAGPKQARLFPKGLLGVTGVPVEDQPGEMAKLAGRLAGDDDSAIAGHAATIGMAGEQLKAAVDAYEAARQAVAVASAQVFRARDAWIRLYEKTYGELVSRVGKRAAEGYFKAPKKLPKPKEPVLPAPPVPLTPTPA